MAYTPIPIYGGVVPQRTQSPDEFSNNADDWLDYQAPLAESYNTLAGQVNDMANRAEAVDIDVAAVEQARDDAEASAVSAASSAASAASDAQSATDAVSTTTQNAADAQAAADAAELSATNAAASESSVAANAAAAAASEANAASSAITATQQADRAEAANTILTGSAPPTDTLGVDGNIYLEY